jgi:thymidylate synthase (FAD)
MPNLIIKRPPTIRTIGRPFVDVDELELFFRDEDVDYEDPTTPAFRMLSDARQNPHQASLLAEAGGRRCYDSFDKGRPPIEYHSNIIGEAHGSVYAHGMYTFTISGVSRALTHELARHSIGIGFSQQSQRYVKADNVNFVMPPLLIYLEAHDPYGPELAHDWYQENLRQLQTYERHRIAYEDGLKKLFPKMSPRMRRKRAAEAARSLLPNAAETRLVWSTNLRAARHIIHMRASEFADAEIQRLVADGIYPRIEQHESAVFADFEDRATPDDILDGQLVSPVGGI